MSHPPIATLLSKSPTYGHETSECKHQKIRCFSCAFNVDEFCTDLYRSCTKTLLSNISITDAFSRLLSVSQSSPQCISNALWVDHTERSVVKSCDLHLPAAVSWQGCRARRSSSCWGIWLQWAWTSPVWRCCSSGSSSCIYPNPASNLNGCWARNTGSKKHNLSSDNLEIIVQCWEKRFLDTLKYLLNPNYCH